MGRRLQIVGIKRTFSSATSPSFFQFGSPTMGPIPRTMGFEVIFKVGVLRPDSCSATRWMNHATLDSLVLSRNNSTATIEITRLLILYLDCIHGSLLIPSSILRPVRAPCGAIVVCMVGLDGGCRLMQLSAGNSASLANHTTASLGAITALRSLQALRFRNCQQLLFPVGYLACACFGSGALETDIIFFIVTASCLCQLELPTDARGQTETLVLSSRQLRQSTGTSFDRTPDHRDDVAWTFHSRYERTRSGPRL